MLGEVKQWLKFFGYEATKDDDWVLDFIIERTENYIKDQCNLSEVPDGLYQLAVEMCAGEFLRRKKTAGGLDGFDLEAAIESVKEGDTTVTYSDKIMTDEQRLDALIAQLTANRLGLFARYRRLVW